MRTAALKVAQSCGLVLLGARAGTILFTGTFGSTSCGALMQRLGGGSIRGAAPAPAPAATAGRGVCGGGRVPTLLPPSRRRPLTARTSHSEAGGSGSSAGDQRDDPAHFSPPSAPRLRRLSPPAPPPLVLRRWAVARRARRSDPVAHHTGVRAARRTRGEVEVVLELPASGGAEAIMMGLIGGGGNGGGSSSKAATDRPSSSAANGSSNNSNSSSSTEPPPPRTWPKAQADRLAAALAQGAGEVLELAVRERAMAAARRGERYCPPQVALASVVLCDDARMRALNQEHRGQDRATDVLTLELRDRDVDRGRVRLPVRLLGDAIISLDTAARQAGERRALEARRRAREGARAGGMGQGGKAEGEGAAAAAITGGKRKRRTESGGGGGQGGKKGFGPAVKTTATTASASARQEDDGYTLLDELRVLLVHGALHLVGMDHEASAREHAAMAAAERRVMAAMGWTRGTGLITAAEAEAEEAELAEAEAEEEQARAAGGGKGGGGGNGGGNGGGGGGGGDDDGGAAWATTPKAAAAAPPSSSSSSLAIFSTRPRLVALDMDGTLLNAASRIDPASARAIRAAVEERGVRVVVATGKARPAALAAARGAGLEGPLLCSEQGPGVFLQGLAVHGVSGEALSDACLPPALVRSALLWAERERVPLCVFLGDECATLRLSPELEELNTRYYEPLAREHACADALLERAALLGGARKLLFMASPESVAARVEPYWRRELEGRHQEQRVPRPPDLSSNAAERGGDAPNFSSRRAGKGRSTATAAARPFAGLADVTLAVPNMLEVVPAGVNKWRGLQALLAHLGVPASALMAVGDGANDLQMVANAGMGVAMGNAVPSVKAAARVVVAGHDEGGIVEAFERFVL